MADISDTLAALSEAAEREAADIAHYSGGPTHNTAMAKVLVALETAYRTGQLVPVPSVEWQPIKTAPKDGTAVLLGYFHENLDGSIYQEGGEPIVARWVPQRGTNAREANWVARSGRLLSGDQAFAPTHWQPLPQPPQQL